jgi:hypothetical protein
MRLLSLRPGGSRIPKTSQRFYNSESSKAKKNVFGGPRASQPKSQNEKLLHSAPTAAASPLNPDEVWVNTKSGKYWKPGSRYYGKTKRGEYMAEKEAAQKGYRPANGTGE